MFSETVKHLILDGLKTTGDYWETLDYIQENLTGEEYKNIESFFQFLIERDYGIGHGNIDDRINEWKPNNTNRVTQFLSENKYVDSYGITMGFIIVKPLSIFFIEKFKNYLKENDIHADIQLFDFHFIVLVK